jgi:hypothetical protein
MKGGADMQRGQEISGDVRISGVINDYEFSAEGEATGNPSTGEYSVKLDYTDVPKGWHPLMYTDVKVSLLFLKEEDGGKNFLSLANGTYTSAGSIDFGEGYVLRNNTNIRMVDDSTFQAVYIMTGTAQMDELTNLQFFEETMLPMGPGKIAALAIARWQCRNDEPLEAIFSTRYNFDSQARLDRPQVRRIEANPTMEGMRNFSSTYTGFVRQLPRMVEEGGPYIGHLIS